MRTHWRSCFAASVVFLLMTAHGADARQAPTAATSSSEAVQPTLAFGGALNLGKPTALEIRVSAQATARIGLDVGLQQAFNGQRIPHVQSRIGRRRDDGTSRYFILGVTYLPLKTRTQVRWPNGSITYLEDRLGSFWPSIGWGFDGVEANGLRAAIELVMVSAGEAGPASVQARLVLQWAE